LPRLRRVDALARERALIEQYDDELRRHMLRIPHN